MTIKEGASASVWSKIMDVDRRVLYWLLIIILAIATLVPFSFPMYTEKNVKDSYDFIETLKNGDIALVNFNVEFAGVAEFGPCYIAAINHLMNKGVKIVIVSTNLQAPLVLERYIIQSGHVEFSESNYEYGRDYVNLGFVPGLEVAIAALATDIHANVKTDYYGTPLEDLTLMRDINEAKDFQIIFTPSFVSFLRHWPDIPMIVVSTAMGRTAVIPFYEAGQVQGFIAGTVGSAMYENILKEPGFAMSNIRPMMIGHLLLVVFIIIGNISYAMEKVKGGGI